MAISRIEAKNSFHLVLHYYNKTRNRTLADSNWHVSNDFMLICSRYPTFSPSIEYKDKKNSEKLRMLFQLYNVLNKHWIISPVYYTDCFIIIHIYWFYCLIYYHFFCIYWHQFLNTSNYSSFLNCTWTCYVHAKKGF